MEHHHLKHPPPPFCLFQHVNSPGFYASENIVDDFRNPQTTNHLGDLYPTLYVKKWGYFQYFLPTSTGWNRRSGCATRAWPVSSKGSSPMPWSWQSRWDSPTGGQVNWRYASGENTTVWEDVGVSENSGFSSQLIHFNRVFYDKPSILGYLYFWKHPCISCQKQGKGVFFHGHVGFSEGVEKVYSWRPIMSETYETFTR